MADIGRSVDRICYKIMIIGYGSEFLETIPFIPQLINISLLLPVQKVVSVEIRKHQTNVIHRENALLKKSLFKSQKAYIHIILFLIIRKYTDKEK
jgi:hypothetical protein